MLPTPAEATRIITAHLPIAPSEDCPLASAHGRILRRPLHADRPLPAFDRITMDGYAVRSADLAGATETIQLQRAGFQAAGMIAQTLAAPGLAIEVATGAVLPHGADAVIPYEDATIDGNVVRIAPGVLCAAGQNIHARGSDFAAGTELVATGTRLTGREIAIAATVGAAHLRVAIRPSVAVIATGDELMEVDALNVGLHQIRRSNDHALRATLLQSGLTSRVERFHLRDNRAEIDASLRRILAEFDVVLLTGGVSKGKLDHIPKALAALQVTAHLHGIAQRPGKPMWFGTSPRRTPVFALPGNPVSTTTCLHRYVLPALRQMAGATGSTAPQPIALGEAFHFAKQLAFMLPVQVRHHADGRTTAHPAPFNTSGDLGGLLGTDGFVELPAERHEFAAGDIVDFWRWT